MPDVRTAAGIPHCSDTHRAVPAGWSAGVGAGVRNAALAARALTLSAGESKIRAHPRAAAHLASTENATTYPFTTDSDCTDENHFLANHRCRRRGYADGVAGLPTGAAADACRYAYGPTIADAGANANGCRRYADAGRCYADADCNRGPANAVSYSNADGNTDAVANPDVDSDPVTIAHTGRPIANRCANNRRPHPG